MATTQEVIDVRSRKAHACRTSQTTWRIYFINNTLFSHFILLQKHKPFRAVSLHNGLKIIIKERRSAVDVKQSPPGPPQHIYQGSFVWSPKPWCLEWCQNLQLISKRSPDWPSNLHNVCLNTQNFPTGSGINLKFSKCCLKDFFHMEPADVLFNYMVAV